MTSRRQSRRAPSTASKLYNVEEEYTSNILASQKINLRKEYVRFCKLYSCEPLDIIASPLEKASSGRDSILVDLRGRGLRGVDCIAIGKILALDAPITHLILSDCLLLPQGFQALMDGLCKNTRLHTIELRGNNIQTTMIGALAKFLKVNCHLQKLLMEWNCIGTSREHFHYITEALKVNTGLQILDIRNNQIGPECAADLASALKMNKSLKELDIRWNSIGLAGAKAIWEMLRVNYTLLKIPLCGNYIPEDIVKCIEDCLKQKSEREALMENYTQRTTLLTRQLQNTEKQHQSEINTIVSVFDAEEAELKDAIKESHQQILDMDERLKNTTLKNHTLSLTVEKLEATMQCSQEKEDTLRKALEIKEQHTEQLESFFRTEIEKLKSNYESRLRLTEDEFEKKGREMQQLAAKLVNLESQLDSKSNEVNNCKENLEMMTKELADSRKLCEEKVKTEKEKWNTWKEELEKAEKREIHMLEAEIKEIQNKMMEHIKVVEKGKLDAEDEIHQLKLAFVNQKKEAEEESNRLRQKLKAECDVLLETYISQSTNTKEQMEKQESEFQRQNAILRKLESENATMLRQNETLRQQVSQLEIELTEKETSIHTSLAKARTEFRDQIDQAEKVEETNKGLKANVQELQEQINCLTLQQNRESMEKSSEIDFLKTQLERREQELGHLKEEDMRRATVLNEAFQSFLRSTSVGTGLALPAFSSKENGTGDAP